MSKKAKDAKQEILDRYSKMEPVNFLEYTALDSARSDMDEVLGRDGITVSRMFQKELIPGAPVRVLIDPDASLASVLSGLRKITAWIERDADSAWFDLVHPEEVPF